MAKKKTAELDPAASAEPRARAATRRRAAGAAGTPSTAPNGDNRREPTYEEIAAAAYRRYLGRGGGHGRDFDDWLEAERELRERQAG